jgi:hypothetical protein
LNGKETGTNIAFFTESRSSFEMIIATDRKHTAERPKEWRLSSLTMLSETEIKIVTLTNTVRKRNCSFK